MTPLAGSRAGVPALSPKAPAAALRTAPTVDAAAQLAGRVNPELATSPIPRAVGTRKAAVPSPPVT